MIGVTERAAKEVARIINEQKLPEGTALRVGVKGGGCSGFSYTLGFDDTFSEVDQVSEIRACAWCATPRASCTSTAPRSTSRTT
jgi:Fe-S cluster assembly iron-binding protein IscA